MKKAALILLGFVVASAWCPPSAWGQYRGARSYTRRIAPQLPPAPQRPTPPPAPASRPAPAPAPAAPARPALAIPFAPAALAAPVETEKQRADREAMVKRTVEFQKARAEAGSETAQYDLGVRYLKGDGVTKDFVLARKWLEASAKQGNTAAAKKLEELKALESKPDAGKGGAERVAPQGSGAPSDKPGVSSEQPTTRE